MSLHDPHSPPAFRKVEPSMFDDLPFVLPDVPDVEPLRMARRADPETSHAAAEEVTASGVAAAQRAAVLEAVRRWPGSTSDELAAAMGVDRYQTARRLPELERPGLVQRAASRPSKLTGRMGITWEPATVPRTPAAGGGA